MLKWMKSIPLLGYIINRLNISKKNLPRKDVFSSHYKENFWGSKESLSGSGSEVSNTKIVGSSLLEAIDKLKISTLLDVPCGDFNWIQSFLPNGLSYTGGDIVADLIDENNRKYSAQNINFIQVDLVEDELPACDAILVRDCLVHLSLEEGVKCVNNIKKSGIKYLLMTTFTNKSSNRDIKTGFWRPLNMQKPPFIFGEPLMLFHEDYKGKMGKNSDKSLGVWRIDELPNLR